MVIANTAIPHIDIMVVSEGRLKSPAIDLTTKTHQ
jgi:hypothetical protein